jgi:hypothetical protein
MLKSQIGLKNLDAEVDINNAWESITEHEDFSQRNYVIMN